MYFRPLAALGALCLVACGVQPAREPAPAADAPPSQQASVAPAECPRAASLDPKLVSEELVCLLRQYIQIDTTNPPGNELVAAQFLKRVLAREGIDAQLIESAPGRANLIARLPGKSRGPALMLMHHMDVVPASAEEWSVPPLSATVKEGRVWGRGSLDNKGGGTAELLAVLLAKRLGVALERDVVLLAVADEESGGGVGARWLVEKHPELFEDVGLILNEGGGILELPGGNLLYTVEIAQKAPLWLRVTARGASGHGSAPSPSAASAVLVRALARLADHHFPIVVLPEVQAVFSARVPSMPEAQRASYSQLDKALKDAAFRRQFEQDPHDAALVHNTLAITMLSGSNKENVISERASAVLDLRLLPGQDPELVTRELRALMAEPSLEVETLLSWKAYRSSKDTPLFAAIERLAHARHPNAPVAANVIGGFTDCNAFRAHDKTCYGFLPMQITLDDIGRIHGKDERIGIDALTDAVLALHALVNDLQGAAPAP